MNRMWVGRLVIITLALLLTLGGTLQSTKANVSAMQGMRTALSTYGKFEAIMNAEFAEAKKRLKENNQSVKPLITSQVQWLDDTAVDYFDMGTKEVQIIHYLNAVKDRTKYLKSL